MGPNRPNPNHNGVGWCISPYCVVGVTFFPFIYLFIIIIIIIIIEMKIIRE